MTENRVSQRVKTGDRLELLLFYLKGRQCFGINVLKVKEVIACPTLTQVPESHPAVRGIAHLRGEPLTVIDLSTAIDRPPLFKDAREARSGSIIITEFNRHMQGFLVERVDRIVVCDWKTVLPPPRATGVGIYVTGVTEIDDHLVEIVDVEKVIGEVMGADAVDEVEADEQDTAVTQGKRVLVVDDSTVARHRTVQTLEKLGVSCGLARDGREALELLHKTNGGDSDAEPFDMVISDIEMPEMDGYTLTREIRKDSHLSGLYTLLHTSLNGAVNIEKAEKAGADSVLTKFVPQELAKAVIKGLSAEQV